MLCSCRKSLLVTLASRGLPQISAEKDRKEMNGKETWRSLSHLPRLRKSTFPPEWPAAASAFTCLVCGSGERSVPCTPAAGGPSRADKRALCERLTRDLVHRAGPLPDGLDSPSVGSEGGDSLLVSFHSFAFGSSWEMWMKVKRAFLPGAVFGDEICSFKHIEMFVSVRRY